MINKSGERGFTLVTEVLAMAIGLIFLLALSTTVQVGITGNNLSKQRTHAVAIGEGVISKSAITRDITPVTGSSLIHGVTYEWNMTVTTTADGYLYIATVYWGYASPNHNIVIKRLVGNAL